MYLFILFFAVIAIIVYNMNSYEGFASYPNCIQTVFGSIRCEPSIFLSHYPFYPLYPWAYY